MLRHAIAPTRRFIKASHDVVRHLRLNSDAKLLLLYVQGLSEAEVGARPLSEHAKRLGLKGRAYQRAKEQLSSEGYLHQWREQGERGRWVTEQMLTNVPLGREGASSLREGEGPSGPPSTDAPSPRARTVGEPPSRSVGDYPPQDELQEKNISHPPSKAEERSGEGHDDPALLGLDSPDGPELRAAERVLLSLRHSHLSLLLGVREARALSGIAAEWLRRGVLAGELRQALIASLPEEGVRCAVGFLRYRLVKKMPEEVVRAPRSGDGRGQGEGLVVCQGPGAEHLFRPVCDETQCGRCRRGEGDGTLVVALPWRERLAGVVPGAVMGPGPGSA